MTSSDDLPEIPLKRIQIPKVVLMMGFFMFLFSLALSVAYLDSGHEVLAVSVIIGCLVVVGVLFRWAYESEAEKDMKMDQGWMITWRDLMIGVFMLSFGMSLMMIASGYFGGLALESTYPYVGTTGLFFAVLGGFLTVVSLRG